MTMGIETEEVSRYLKMKSIVIPSNNYWLSSCVDCFKDQENYDLKQIKELVYQQWLLADLSDIAVQVLPDSCLTAEKSVLQGRYAVQLNCFVNIAVSFHKQLQKIRRPEVVKNLEVDSDNSQNKEVVSGNRVLKIEITDGVLTVIAFEDHVIPSLQEPLVPGKKAILVGPLECRKGILFLRPCNIQILGGEVDALHIPNAMENILARALKLPENPDPYKLGVVKHENNINFDDDDDEMMMLADDIENNADITVNDTRRLNNDVNHSKTFNTAPSAKVDTVQRNIAMPQQDQHFNSFSNDPFIADDFDVDMAELEKKISINKKTESIVFDDDFELLEQQTTLDEKMHKSLNNSSSIDNSISNMIACQELDIASSKKQYEEITELKKKLNESYNTNDIRPSTSGNKNLFSEESSSNILKKDRIVFDYLSQSESPLAKLPDDSESSEFTSCYPTEVGISDNTFFSSDPFPPRKRPALVKTPARVVKVLKKPKLKGDKWSVNAVVAARGIELEVTFASEVIDQIFSISAAEIISRRTELVSDPAMKQKMNETLKNSQVRFSTLSCVMVFSFKDAISKPVIVDIE